MTDAYIQKLIKNEQDRVLDFTRIDGHLPILDKEYYFALGYLKGLIHELSPRRNCNPETIARNELYSNMQDLLEADRHHYTTLDAKERAVLKIIQSTP